jgi:hypothetical protein
MQNEREEVRDTKVIPAQFSARSSEPRKPRDEEIRSRAYQIYVAHKRTPGRAVDDWLQAERELLSQV